jgi:CRISPR-associated protein Cas5h
MQKIVSINLKSDFGFFRKPDANNTINLSYNMLHKPALLGILGAIIGLEGYKEKGKFPEFYEKLKNLMIGIEPLDHEKGNFQKTVIKYTNTIGYANNGSNFLTEEATLIKPSYRVYLLLDLNNEDHNKLYTNLKTGQSEYIPYFGKNEFPIWWDKDDFEEYDFEKVEKVSGSYKVNTIFEKKEIVKNQTTQVFDLFNFQNTQSPFIYFERLPKGFNEELFQYELGEFVYTSYNLKSDYVPENTYLLKFKEVHVQLH